MRDANQGVARAERSSGRRDWGVPDGAVSPVQQIPGGAHLRRVGVGLRNHERRVRELEARTNEAALALGHRRDNSSRS